MYFTGYDTRGRLAFARENPPQQRDRILADLRLAFPSYDIVEGVGDSLDAHLSLAREVHRRNSFLSLLLLHADSIEEAARTVVPRRLLPPPK